jgi:hypothetical protein
LRIAEGSDEDLIHGVRVSHGGSGGAQGHFREIFQINDPLRMEVTPARVDLPSGRFVFLALPLCSLSNGYPFTGISMKNTTLVVSTLVGFATLGMASVASGAVVVLNSQFAWNAYTAIQGATVATETFESFANGYQPSAMGAVGGTTWTANASIGQITFQTLGTQKVISTALGGRTLSFTFAPGVQGIGGEMFGTNASFEVVLSEITVTLADGTSYVNDQTSASDFVGFYSNGAAIASISVSTSTQGTYATVDNLYFATVPAPGALALLSLAGVVGGRSRRRAYSATV